MSTFLWIVGVLCVSGGSIARCYCSSNLQSDVIEEIETAERHESVMDPSYAQLQRARATDEFRANAATRRYATWCITMGIVALLAAAATTFITL
jgi:hypothetical protein